MATRPRGSTRATTTRCLRGWTSPADPKPFPPLADNKGRDGDRKGWGDEWRAIERLKRGDVGGLETLARNHQTRAVRTAYLIVRQRALTEHVVPGLIDVADVVARAHTY